jgi:hypothetical protein
MTLSQLFCRISADACRSISRKRPSTESCIFHKVREIGPRGPGVTRWLSNGEATLRIYRNYPVLVKDLGYNSSSGCAATNLNTMLSQKFVSSSSLCFFADLLRRQNTLSRIFQYAHVCIRGLKHSGLDQKVN